MPIFGGASGGAVLKVRCPHCYEFQARARIADRASYCCKLCGKKFTKEAGLAGAKETTSSKKSR